MKNATIIIGIILLIVVAGAFILKNSGSGSALVKTKAAEQVQGEVQKVILSMKDYNYYPNTIKVKAGTPVELTLDKSVFGCLRSFRIKDLGVSQLSRNPNEKITFVPDKKGTFTFSCSMGMGYGKLIVE